MNTSPAKHESTWLLFFKCFFVPDFLGKPWQREDGLITKMWTKKEDAVLHFYPELDPHVMEVYRYYFRVKTSLGTIEISVPPDVFDRFNVGRRISVKVRSGRVNSAKIQGKLYSHRWFPPFILP